MEAPKLFKVRVTIGNEYLIEKYDTTGFNDRDRLLVNFALQLGYNVHIKSVDDSEIS